MENIILNASTSLMGQLPSEVWGVSLVAASLGVTILIVALVVWSIIWKGIALWKAARLGQKWWFIILLLVNTVGILEIIYIFLIARKRE